MIDIHIIGRKRAVIIRHGFDLIRLERNKLFIRIIDAIKSSRNQILSCLDSCAVLPPMTIQSLVALPLISRLTDVQEGRTDIRSIPL